MAIPQQKFRELVFQLIYSRDIGESDPKALIPMLMKEQAVTRKTAFQAQDRAEQVWEERAVFDTAVEEASEEYALERIQVIERNILRLSLFEALKNDLPPKIAISEAVRLARKFGTPEGGKYINAIMDAIFLKRGLLEDEQRE